VLGEAVTLEQLDEDPHPVLARLREREPVAWVPALEGWLVTRYDLAVQVMRDSRTFTVDDPRFSTAQVVGSSMLSLDGPEHDRHRAPFAAPFRPTAVRERFTSAVVERAETLIDGFAPTGAAELRREFAGPLAASTMAAALGLREDEVPDLLAWYDGIVGAVTQITAGEDVAAAGRNAFASLRARLLQQTLVDGPGLTREQVVSNAAVLLFGGIETTEGMIANAALALLRRPRERDRVAGDPSLLAAAVEESLRLEPAAAVVDRYAAADTVLGGAAIAAGDLVRVSIAGANRDPAMFRDPERFDPARPRVRRHLAFAHGPHVCLGIHLARLEARLGLAALLRRLPDIRLDPARPSAARGLVFRKPPALHVVW
jgi:cytochrome P450